MESIKKIIKARPTKKQRDAAKAIVVNEISKKPKSIGKVLETVGYGTALQDQPGRVLGSEGFKEALQEEAETMLAALRNQGVTPDQLASKVYDLLHATKKVYKNNNTTGQVEEVGETDDWWAVDKGLSHAFKLGAGGGYKTSQSPTDEPPNPQVFNNPTINIMINNFEGEVKKKIMEQFAPKEKQNAS